MVSEGTSRLPRFSLAELFWFASAVAIGFAVSQTTSSEEPESWFTIAEQAFYSPTLLAIAAVLVVYELVRQTLLLRRIAGNVLPHRFELKVAWVSRASLAARITGLLLITLLMNQQILLMAAQGESLQFYGVLWPATLLGIVLLLAMRLMVANGLSTEVSDFRRSVSALIVAIGIVAIGLYIVTDRLAITWLVHLALDGVEKSHAARWQRPDVYPHHAAEGFRSFWSALAAVLVVLTGSAGLVLTTRVRTHAVTVLLWVLFATSIAFAIGYTWWFATREFPRISPDLAGESLPTRWPDLLAGAVLLLGMAAVIGYQLAKVRIDCGDLPEQSPCELPKPSGLMAIAAGLIALGCGSDSLLLANDALTTTSWWAVSNLPWVNRLAVLAQYIIMPESVITLAAAISGICIVWQYYRLSHELPPLAPVNGSHFVIYTLATTALLLAAVPTFAAFGFCYWLGPWVL